MKRLFFALLLAVFAPVSARAVDVTLSQFTIQNYQAAGTLAYVRFYYSETVTDSAGTIIPGGLSGSANFYRQITCSVNTSTRVATCPSTGAVTLASTTDSNRPAARVTVALFNSARQKLSDLYTVKVPHTLGGAVTLQQLITYTAAPQPPLNDQFYTANQVNTQIAAALSGGVSATDPRVSSVVNVKAHPYSAAGDGVTDDTAAIQAALTAALAARKPLYFPAGNYRVSGAGAQIFLVTKAIEIYGDGDRLSRIVPHTTVPTTTDIFRVSPPVTVNQPDTWFTAAALDNEGLYWHDFGIAPASEPSLRTHPYPSQPGRHAIHLDITTAGQFLMNSRFERLYLGAFSGRGMYFNNSNGAGGYRNQDGFAEITVEKSSIRNGITGVWWGDMIRILDNDLVGQGVCVESTQVPGASNLTILGNRQTCQGGTALVHNGRHVLYEENEDELYVASSTGASGANAHFAGDNAIIEHVVYRNNHCNANLGVALDCVRLDGARVVVIDGNRFSGLTGKVAVRTTVFAFNPFYGINTVEANATNFALTNGADAFPIHGVRTSKAEPDFSNPLTYFPDYTGVEKVHARNLRVTGGPTELGSLAGKGMDIFWNPDARITAGAYFATGGGGASTFFSINRDTLAFLGMRFLGGSAVFDMTDGTALGQGSAPIKAVASAQGVLDFAQAAAGGTQTITFALPGPADDGTWVLSVQIPNSLMTHNATADIDWWISGTGTVSVKRKVVDADASDPSAVTARAMAIKF